MRHRRLQARPSGMCPAAYAEAWRRRVVVSVCYCYQSSFHPDSMVMRDVEITELVSQHGMRERQRVARVFGRNGLRVRDTVGCGCRAGGQ